MDRDRYRFHAKIYDRFFEPAAARLRATGLSMFPPRDNLSILDVGCGTGTQLALYQKPGCRLFGIDLSPAMLAVAQQELGESATLRLEDASKLTFDGGTFDFVTAILILHEMPAGLRSSVLSECARVVKPDGRIMLIDYHFGPYPFPMGWVWKVFVTFAEISMGREHYTNYRDFLGRRGLEALIAKQSLAIDKQFVTESGVAAIYLLKR